MKFNINNKVKVRLTQAGKDELLAQHDELREAVTSLHPYSDPAEDEQGYSTWQLWVLMSTFGDVMCNGGEMFFDAEIIIPDESNKDSSPKVDEQYSTMLAAIVNARLNSHPQLNVQHVISMAKEDLRKAGINP